MSENERGPVSTGMFVDETCLKSVAQGHSIYAGGNERTSRIKAGVVARIDYRSLSLVHLLVGSFHL